MSCRRLAAGLGLALLIACGSAAADEASHRRAAERLLAADGTATTMRSAMDIMMRSKISASPEIILFEGVIRAFVEKYMSFEALKEDLISLYVADFSEAELDELTAFYRTPTGSKAIARMPVFMARSSQMVERRMLENQGELLRMIQEEQRRLGLSR